MKKLLLSFLSICLVVINGNAQAFQWAHIQGTRAPVLANDGDNLITAAQASGQFTLGNQTFSHQGMHGYLAKHNSGGAILWANHLIGVFYRLAVETDVNKNIILSGVYQDSLHINGLIFKSGPSVQRLFVAKFDPNGNLLWARNSGNYSNGFVHFMSLATDNSGNIYFSGNYSNSFSFDSTFVNSNGHSDVFLSKFNSQGNLQWIQNFGNSNSEEISSVICGQSNDVYLKFSSRQYQSSSAPEGIHIYKLNSAGSQLWNKMIATPSQYDSDISLDSTDNLYLAGSASGVLQFDNINLNLLVAANQNHIYLAKINSAGTWQWAKAVATGSYRSTGLRMAKRAAGHVYLFGGIQGAAVFGSQNPTISGTENFIAKLDTSGFTQTLAQIKPSGFIMQYDQEITTDKNGNPYIAATFGGPGLPVNGSLTLGQFTLNISTMQQSLGYFAKLLANPNTVTGNIFIDANGNGIKDLGEAGFENGLIGFTPGNLFSSSAANGDFTAYLTSGTYNLNVHQPAAHYTISPQSHSVTFSGLGQSQTRDFALTPIPNRNDVKVSVTNLTPARPGFSLNYRVTIENIGTTTLSDSITLSYPANHLTYSSATVAPANQQTGKLNWFYQPLQPNEKRNINVEFLVAAATGLNTNLQTLATVKPFASDFNTWNNSDTLNLIVTGAFDPNDKLVSHDRISPAQVAGGQLLDYIIRFQNTGTDTAFTVIVRDSISTRLHMPSLELLSASHPYTFRLLENGMAEWRFDNILLPDSNRNEPASHGFIRYRMQPKTNLVLGDEIRERAAIYFDFNAPILTNYAVTRIANPLSNKKPKPGLQPFQLYPNPAQNYVMVAADMKKPTAATVRLVNILGQILSEVKLPANSQLNYQLLLNNLPKGVYIVQLETEQGRQAQRLVVQ